MTWSVLNFTHGVAQMQEEVMIHQDEAGDVNVSYLKISNDSWTKKQNRTSNILLDKHRTLAYAYCVTAENEQWYGDNSCQCQVHW